MAITVKFKTGGIETAVANDNIMQLRQTANMFSSSFRLGATVCRQFDLDIDKAAFSGGLNTNPDEVILYEGGTVYATLVIDEIDDSNDAYYAYTLTDRMVRLGDSQTWVVPSGSWQNQINNICTVYGLGTPPTLTQYGTVALSWAEDMTAREFVGYLAEILGGYAYITSDNKLAFQAFSMTAADTIAVEDCSSFKVDNSTTYDRVVYQTSTYVYKYPEDGNYTGTGATYYVDPNNQLMTDDTVNTPPTIDIETEVQYIYGIINGFTFYNITTEKCPIDGDVKCGDYVEFTLDGNTYGTIAQIDWNYNSMWFGGYTLAIGNELQEETAVSPLKSATNRITQYIDRELGEVGTRIETVEEGVSANASAITQNAQQITATVQQLREDIPEIVGDAGFATSAEVALTAEGLTTTINSVQQTGDDRWAQLQTYIQLDANGVTVGKSDSNIKGVFGNSSLDFVDEQGNKQAWLDANEGLGAVQLSVGDANTISKRWRIFATADGDHLRFTRHN